MNSNVPKYWVACSGGLDSVVLVQLLAKRSLSLGVLHMNFQLRGKESDDDEQFVRNLAIELKIPFRSKKVDVATYKKKHKVNTQLAARELRYEWFNELIAKEKAIVCLAHHADDQLENFLIQLERGASVKGIAGMRTFKNNFFRPLLRYSKEELRDLAVNQNWKWREDGSNQKTIYKRNWYRIVFIPELLSNEQRRKEVLGLVKNYQVVDGFLEGLLHQQSNVFNASFDWLRWHRFPILVQQSYLRKWSISISQLSEINRLQRGTKGGKIVFEKVIIWNDGDGFFVEKKKHFESAESKLYITPVNYDEVEFSNEFLYVDLDKVQGKLSVDRWQKGDRFQPLGMTGTKLVSDFLIDRKVPVRAKRNVKVIKDKEKIIGVMGYAPSEQVKIDQNTKNIIRIALQPIHH